jgi:hypothetical protein
MSYLNRVLPLIRDLYDFKAEDDRFQRKIGDFLSNFAENLGPKNLPTTKAFLIISG